MFNTAQVTNKEPPSCMTKAPINIRSVAPTMSEFMQTLEKAAQAIRQEPQVIAAADKPKNQHKAAIAILAGVDLFMRFVTRNSHDFSVDIARMLMYMAKD